MHVWGFYGGRRNIENDSCPCGCCGVVGHGGRVCSRAIRRCGIRRVVRCGRLRARGCGCRRHSWLYGGTVYCSLLGPEAFRTALQTASYKAVHYNKLKQSRVEAGGVRSWCGSAGRINTRVRYTTTCHAGSRHGDFSTTSEIPCGNDRRTERATRPRFRIASLEPIQEVQIHDSELGLEELVCERARLAEARTWADNDALVGYAAVQRSTEKPKTYKQRKLIERIFNKCPAGGVPAARNTMLPSEGP